MKVKRMGITEILRRIWLFSANKIKSFESFSKQPTQLIVKVNSSLRHIIVTFDSSELILSQTLILMCCSCYWLSEINWPLDKITQPSHLIIFLRQSNYISSRSMGNICKFEQCFWLFGTHSFKNCNFDVLLLLLTARVIKQVLLAACMHFALNFAL